MDFEAFARSGRELIRESVLCSISPIWQLDLLDRWKVSIQRALLAGADLEVVSPFPIGQRVIESGSESRTGYGEALPLVFRDYLRDEQQKSAS